MIQGIPPPVAAFLKATADGDLTAFLSTFAEGAVLVDEGKTYRGRAIREWGEAKYIGARVTLDVLEIGAVSGSIVVNTHLRRAGEPILIPQPNATATGDRPLLELDFIFAAGESGISNLTILVANFRRRDEVI